MKQKILHIAAQAWSILLYPLWIPTYGMLMLYAFFTKQGLIMPVIWWGICITCTFLMTALIPLGYILYLYRRHMIRSLYIEDAAQRTIPYRMTALCYAFWSYFLASQLHMPLVIVVVAIGATLALILVTLINKRWKISAHLTSVGGLLGGVFSYALYSGTMPTIGFMSTFLSATLLLMYARLYLRAHTSLQVVAGLLLGLCATFIPNMIIYYVQIH